MKKNCEKEAAVQMAKEILTAARTAPKAKGIDNIVTYLLENDEKETLANAMDKAADKLGAFLSRDANNVRNSDVLILIGLKDAGTSGLNCGSCGFETCIDLKNAAKPKKTPFKGPFCSIKVIDLGIAVGSAAAKAKDLCLDNRVFYSAGAVACSIKMIDADYAFAIPLSISGKSIYFDRKM